MAASGGKVYVIGGNNYYNPPLASVSRFDPGTNAWERAPFLNTARGGHASGVLNGTLFALGGVHLFGVISSVELFDPAGNDAQWSVGIPMGTARSAFGAAAVGGTKVVAVGGVTQMGNVMATAEAFDLATQAWGAVASMARARAFHAVASAGGLVYAMGGCGVGNGLVEACTEVEAFDVAQNAWSPVANMTSARKAFAAASANGKIYAMGGASPPNGYGCKSVEVYDPSTKAWAAAPPMGTSRYIFAATALGPTVYVSGSFDEATHAASTSAEAFTTAATAGEGDDEAAMVVA